MKSFHIFFVNIRDILPVYFLFCNIYTFSSNINLDIWFFTILHSINIQLDQEKFLNKEERRILSGQLKPAPTGYSLFLKHVYPEYKESGKSSSEIFSSIGARWRALSSTKKAEFIGTASEVGSFIDFCDYAVYHLLIII